jgi:hypothetical protein
LALPGKPSKRASGIIPYDFLVRVAERIVRKNPKQITTRLINFDRSGTTRIGKYVINHSFLVPGLVSKVKPQYDALATELRQAPALHSDETSWSPARAGGCGFSLPTYVISALGAELLGRVRL